MTAARRLPALALLLAVTGAALTIPRPAPVHFAPPPARPAPSGLPQAPSTDFLPRVAPSAHAANLLALQDGDVLLSWFAGSREGAKDVAIYLARWHAAGPGTLAGQWTPPRPVATRATTMAATGRYVRKLGNAVVGQAPDGRLHLWYVGVSVGGWAGASINHQTSANGGQSWGPARHLVTSPFLNVSTLVRTPPLWPTAAGAGPALPVYHEFIAKHGEWLRLDEAGRVMDKVRIPQPRRALQPAVAALDDGRLLALLRDAGRGPGHVLRALSGDGGAHWQATSPLPVANPKSAVSLLRLTDGRLLLACNPVSGNRNRLSLWASADQGEHWREIRILEADSGNDEYSYPALAQDRAGRVHVAYTWKRQTIRHWTLSPTNLEDAGS